MSIPNILLSSSSSSVETLNTKNCVSDIVNSQHNTIHKPTSTYATSAESHTKASTHCTNRQQNATCSNGCWKRKLTSDKPSVVHVRNLFPCASRYYKKGGIRPFSSMYFFSRHTSPRISDEKIIDECWSGHNALLINIHVCLNRKQPKHV